MKTKYDTDMGPYLKEKAMTPTKCDGKRREETTNIFSGIATRSNAPNETVQKKRTRMDKFEIDKLIRLNNRFFYRNETNLIDENVLEPHKQTRKHRKTSERNWLNKKNIMLFRILAQVTCIKFYNFNHRQELTGKTVARKTIGYAESSGTATTKDIRQGNQKKILYQKHKHQTGKKSKKGLYIK